MDRQRVYPARHQVRERLVHEPMAGERGLAGEFARYDHELVMSAAVLGPGVSGVLMALVEHLQCVGCESCKTLADQVRRGHLGKTLRNGLTVTLAKTPSVT